MIFSAFAGFVGVEIKMVCRKGAIPIHQISSDCAGYNMVNMLAERSLFNLWRTDILTNTDTLCFNLNNEVLKSLSSVLELHTHTIHH